MIGRTNCTQKGGSPSEFVNIQMLTNQAEHSNLNGAVLTMSYETYSKQYTWDGSEITFSVPAHVSCTIEFPEVEGYKKPDNITFVAVEGNSRTIEAEYKAELVKVNVSSSNGSAVSGAKITINGKQHTWNGTEIRQLVPFGTQYSVVAGAVSGFGTPSTQTFTAQNPEREVSVVYIASSLKVNILSNQGTDAAVANVKATVKYGSTSVQVANGGTVNLPTNTSVIISFPEVADYKKPADITYTHTGGLVEKSGTYQCELLTVNVSADSGSVSGFEVTISKQEVVGVATKYTRLEYIESNGTQYIDTGFKPNNNTRVLMDICVTQGVTSSFFGTRSGANTQTFTAFCLSTTSLRSDYNTTQKTLTINGVGERVIVDADKNSFSYGNYTTTHSSGAFNCPYNLYLLQNNYQGSADDNSCMYAKLYSCKIYDNGTLVRDYIPVLRSDGIAGLYDAVNDIFAASSGSGNFIAGSKQEDVISTQTSVTGTYKIPFDTSYVVKASNVNGYTTPSSVTRVANSKSYTVTQEYKVITVRDLSLMDVYGNPINRSTANCYVVREPGQYKFPLVYGNAIKNGQVNTAAFTNNGGINSHDFVNAWGAVITNPFIEQDNVYVGIKNYDTDKDVISNATVEEESGIKYCCFTVSNVPNTGANIILSARYAEDIWSWHIWLWPHDLTPVEITNSTGVKYNIMPVNLASKYDDDIVHIKNWFYQWGRPNPMLLPSAWNSTTDHTPGSITKASKASDLVTGLVNPTTFYYNASEPGNWFGDKSYYNLWDAACIEAGESDNDTVKTVYDPCPVGWKIPNGNTFKGLDYISIDNGIIKMRRYSGDTVGVGFPISGYRFSSTGAIYLTGDESYVWTSAALNNKYAYAFYFSKNLIVTANAFGRRASGYSVRPVQDDLTKIDII